MGGTCTGSACAVNLFVSSVNINVFFSLTRALCYSGSRCTNVAVIDFHLDKLIGVTLNVKMVHSVGMGYGARSLLFCESL